LAAASALRSSGESGGGGIAARRAARQEARRRMIRRRRIIVGTLLAVVVLPALFLSWSIVGALRTPGNEDFKAKWADWLRGHDAAFIVTPLENWYYSRNQPKKGGQPSGLNPIPGTNGTAPPATQGTAVGPAHLTPPRDLSLLVQPGLPNEGHWQATGQAIDGVTAMYVAQFRADQVYTGQITTAVWIDARLARVRLIPGAHEPGGQWSTTPCIGGDAAAHAMAAFNGGFRFQDAKGGFYAEGREAVPLQNGAASIVINKDGHLAIGMWGRDFHVGPDTETVLQNLTLMVDHGQLDPDISHNDTSKWGSTLKGKIAVARSGIGITADGALVYVAGPALTARTLAESLQRAGAVEAFSLDINPEWVTFNFYEHANSADPKVVTGAKLYPEMTRPASRYLCPTAESRDFFTISTP
jgi:hypothetical protein